MGLFNRFGDDLEEEGHWCQPSYPCIGCPYRRDEIPNSFTQKIVYRLLLVTKFFGDMKNKFKKIEK
jgi:hypothetical protein